MSALNVELKALFSQLVDAIGTHEAAATFLGISRQRVGQIISTNEQYIDNLPTWGQVRKLEEVCGQSIVFGALARKVDGDVGGANTMTAAVTATATASRALEAVHAAKADGIVEPHELENVRDRARENLEAAQRQFDAAMNLRPTLRAVS